MFPCCSSPRLQVASTKRRRSNRLTAPRWTAHRSVPRPPAWNRRRRRSLFRFLHRMAARTTSAASRPAWTAMSTSGSRSIHPARRDTGRSAYPVVTVLCPRAADRRLPIAGARSTPSASPGTAVIARVGFSRVRFHTWGLHHSFIHTHDATAATARDAGVAAVRACRCERRESYVEEQLFTRYWTCRDGVRGRRGRREASHRWCR